MNRPTPNDAAPLDHGRAWYRQGIAWLGITVFAASIAGCLWLIAVAQRSDDPSLVVSGTQILNVPVAKPPRTAPATP